MKLKNNFMSKKGIFTISIDYEFAWGYADKLLSLEDKTRIRKEIEIVKRLILLFEKYNIPATWAIVGHLLEKIEKKCEWSGDNLPHPEYKRPIYKNETHDYFFQHPDKNNYSDSLWYDNQKLILQIKQSSACHEIASHSYAHIRYDEQNTNEQAICVDIANSQRVHTEEDLPYKSFVFPRNVEGFHKQLQKAGLTHYRGNSYKWYMFLPQLLQRLGHFCDYLIPSTPVSAPLLHFSGLVNIRESMLLLGRNGLRKFITPSMMIKKVKNGIQKASNKKEIFHLWFHPSNFSYDTEKQFWIFEEILKRATKMRDENKLDIQTMSAIGNKLKEKN